MYQTIGVSVVNAWLKYRRHCNQSTVPKKDIVPLRDFQTRVAVALIKAGKDTTTTKRGRPTLTPATNTKPKTSSKIPLLAPEIRYDGVDHLLKFDEKQGRCTFSPKDLAQLLARSATLSVQNLACIKFGDWQISDFWRGFNLAIQNIG